MLKFLRSLFRSGDAESKRNNHIRSAGKDAMRDPPRHWDKRDEASDETFPASDPITKY